MKRQYQIDGEITHIEINDVKDVQTYVNWII